jgi:hypothetical protein
MTREILRAASASSILAGEMFEEMKQVGFSSVSALSYYSLGYGYLGDKQIQFLAEN